MEEDSKEVAVEEGNLHLNHRRCFLGHHDVVCFRVNTLLVIIV